MLTPIKLMFFFPSTFLRPYIPKAETMVPLNEKRKTYENREPEMIACPIILIIISKKNKEKEKISIPIMSGIFASPIRIKGKGLGIMYSIVEKKKQRAPNKATF